MVLSWLRTWRRRRIVAEPFPESWSAIVHENVVLQRHLTPEQRAKLNRLVQVFVAEKNWEGCGGLTLTDEMKVTIAAQACLLVVGRTEDIHFDHVLSILVYPDAYVATVSQTGRAGVVVEGGQARLGEAWFRGPVVLSWKDARAGGRRETPGQNLVLHEFTHQLDMMNGRVVDGTPTLATEQQLQRWIQVLGPEFQQLAELCRRHQRGFIDCYGATDPGEFFAVLTEAFFDRPRDVRAQRPQVYDVLRDYYQLDPAEWTLFE